MKHLLAKIQELETREFNVVESRGSLALHQTQRNKAKAELVEAFYLDLKEFLNKEGYNVYITSSGPIIEFLNENVEDQIFARDEKGYTGMISIQLDAVMKNLDVNGENEELDYKIALADRLEKEKKAEEAKQRKIQKDAEIRAERSRRREEEMLRAQMLREQAEDSEGN